MMNRRRVAVALPMGALLALLVHCGGSEVNNAVCGPGTFIQNGECVSGQSDGGTESGSDAFVGGDTVAADTVGTDTVTSADGPFDSAPPDGGEPPADQCPNLSGPIPVLLECDPVCCVQDPYCVQHKTDAGVDPQCSSATCDNGPLSHNQLGPVGIVRTPGSPGVAAKCTSLCPSGGYVYGLGFDFTSLGSFVKVQVGTPWEIVAHSQTPYCADANAIVTTTGCAVIGIAVDPFVYVMTKDPNAPARNITFQASSTQPACP
jgi:hypothetical protein